MAMIISQTTDLADLANRSRLASAMYGLHPIAACPHACVIAKNGTLLPLCTNHGWQKCMHAYVGFTSRRFPGLWLGIAVPAT